MSEDAANLPGLGVLLDSIPARLNLKRTVILMTGYTRFEVFTRTFGLHVEDAPPLIGTNDPAEAYRTCRSAMRFETGTLQTTCIRDRIIGKEYSGLEVFAFGNQYGLVIPE